MALSPRTSVELGIALSEEDRKRPYVEVSGRKGLGVKADDLIDKLIENARIEVDSRHPEDPEAERQQVATQIATGALRYFMLKYTRTSVIAFDFQKPFSFEGEKRALRAVSASAPATSFATGGARRRLPYSLPAHPRSHVAPTRVRGTLALGCRSQKPTAPSNAAE